ncbi:MAG: HAMP domain-containing histidine kinase [Proteobacteria bacterium]|nr:MAG: HAMP domain-containing histidine kinase [Pseudomonadota bacterium]
MAAVSFNGVTTYFFRNERIHLIDYQIQRVADTLMHSEDFKNNLSMPSEQLDHVITDILGPGRIGKVYILRDLSGTIIYESFNVALLQTPLPIDPPWLTVGARDQYVRIFNAHVSNDRILQVGMVLDNNFVNWRIFDARTLGLIFLLVIGLFGISAALTLVLMSPIRILNDHLTTATSDLKNLKDVDRLPEELLKLRTNFWAKADEFSSLIATVQKLIDRINRNYKLTRSWTLQMAHELKTPLAIIRSETESRAAILPKDFTPTILKEIDWTSDTITQFLSWAELENSHPHKTLHILRMSTVVQNACDRIAKLGPNRVDITLVKDFSVAASAGHLDQLVTNLLTNAFKFSPTEKPIRVTIGSQKLVISDEGPGIDEGILERIGEPFNIGLNKSHTGLKGTGLGLAWVSTVSKLYDWKLKIDSKPGSGTSITITFPEL